MVHSIEFSGRIGRTDGKLVAAGRFDLSFRLHADRDSTVALWEEDHDGVSVGTGGAFHVVLGEANGLSASLFATSPRWLSIWVRRGDSVMEAAERVALTGLQLRLAEEVARIREQVEASPVAQLPGTSNVDVEARRRLVRVHRRVRRIEGGGGILHGLLGRVADRKSVV